MLTNNRGLRVAKTSQNEKQEKKRKGKCSRRRRGEESAVLEHT